jgi:hypothetical protein
MGSEFSGVRSVMAGLLALLGTAALVLEGPAVAQNVVGSPVAETVQFLRSQDPDARGAFFSTCKLAAPAKSRSENYVLVVPLGARQAFLALTVEHEGKLITANMATLSLGGGKFSVEEAMGGEWTYQRLQAVTNDLLTKRFRLTFDYTTPFERESAEQCAAPQ